MNVASRLESSGVSGRIQVSEQVARILEKHGQFELECRGPIEVKGKGLLTTYLVVTPFDSVEELNETRADDKDNEKNQDDEDNDDGNNQAAQNQTPAQSDFEAD